MGGQTGHLRQEFGIFPKQSMRFIFDSSHHLNCHSNFIPKIAPLDRHRSGE
jgi:hypothetical protein